jgi:hypothetical protein
MGGHVGPRKENFMKISRFLGILALAVACLVLARISLQAVPVQSGADEVLAKKYAKILGRYDLDLTALGGDMHPTDVIVREGKLWIDDGDGRPAEIKPVGDSSLEFEGQDDNNGAVKVTFIADDSGAVTKMHLVMPDAGLDAYGNKVK